MEMMLLIVIVLTSGAGAIFLYYYGLKKIPASLATICELFWPFSAVILDYILHGNILTGLQIPAFFVLLFCFYLAIIESKKINFNFKARVIKGEGKGRKLGFPTANLDKIDLPLNFGVYKVEAVIDDKWHLGLLHYGLKETFKNNISTDGLALLERYFQFIRLVIDYPQNIGSYIQLGLRVCLVIAGYIYGIAFSSRLLV